jgi:hypothetical protein
MGEPKMSTELVVVERPPLKSVPKVIRSQRSNLSDGWLLFAPIAGGTAGTLINEFGVYGLAGSVVGGLGVAAWVTVVPAKFQRRCAVASARFTARARLAITAGGS